MSNVTFPPGTPTLTGCTRHPSVVPPSGTEVNASLLKAEPPPQLTAAQLATLKADKKKAQAADYMRLVDVRVKAGQLVGAAARAVNLSHPELAAAALG